MLIYYVIIIVWFIIELIYLSKKKKYSVNINESMQKKLIKFLFIILIFVCAFRAYDRQHYIGIDTRGYYESYIQKTNYSLQANQLIENISGDPGYYLLECFLGYMSLPFNFLLIIEAFVYIGAIYLFIKHYSKDPIFSTLFFICLLFSFSMSTIRQSLAMGICLLAYMLYYKYKERKMKAIITYGLLVMLAISFHKSAIVFVPAILISKIKYNKKLIFVFLSIAALTMIFKNQFANFVISWAGGYSDKYAASYSVTGDNVGTKFYIFILFFILLNIIFSKKLNKNSESDSLIYMMLTMLIIFPAVQSGGAMMRIYYYYYMFAPVYIANTLNCLADKNLRLIVKLFIIVFLIYLFLNGNFVANRLAPYYFSFSIL
ncbi:MAG: EpsG family protein [Clostridia bacterium]|nr:EpsG family protein [Clostridia bacterium]